MATVDEKIKTAIAPTNLLEEMKLLKEMQQDQTGLFVLFRKQQQQQNLAFIFIYSIYLIEKWLSFLFLINLNNKSVTRKSISSELWHACAGPLVSLPQVGSLVYYFPQGHSEQVFFIFILVCKYY